VELKGKSAAEFLANFEQKGPKSGRPLTKIVSLLLSSLILLKSKKYYYFPEHTCQNNVFLKPKFLQKGKTFYLGADFFPQWPNFSSGLAEKVLQRGWQHCRERRPLPDMVGITG
jgi:hypothetical protein